MVRQHSPTEDLQALRAVTACGKASAHERLVMIALILHRNGKTRCRVADTGFPIPVVEFSPQRRRDTKYFRRFFLPR